MANILTTGQAYDPYFYASAALMQLNKRLGLAAFVHRGYEAEKGMERGSTIRLRRPGKFTARDMPIAEASARDITPEYMDITLDQWKGDVFSLTDKELSYTKERVIEEHIDPLAIAVADAIDQSLNGLHTDVPWIIDDDSTTPINDFSNMRERFFLNKAPRSGDYNYQLDSVLQKRYEQQQVFYQANTGVDAQTLQRDGFLGRKFGFNMFANQNSPTQAAGTLSTTTLAVNGAATKGATTINLDAGTLTGSIVPGTSLTLTGHTQKYAVTNTVAASGNALAAVGISPQLQEDVADDVVVTADQTAATSVGLAFHRQAFALVMAPLSTVGDGLGIKMATMADPVTGLVLRTRLWASGGSAKVFVGIDALWGVKTLDPNLAVRLRI